MTCSSGFGNIFQQGPCSLVHALVAIGGRLERGLSKVGALEGVKLQMGTEGQDVWEETGSLDSPRAVLVPGCT